MKTEFLQSQLDELLTVRDLCKGFGGVTVVTIHAWRKQGLPTIVIKGTKRPSIRFYFPDVLKWATEKGRIFRLPVTRTSARRFNARSIKARPITAQRHERSASAVIAA